MIKKCVILFIFSFVLIFSNNIIAEPNLISMSFKDTHIDNILNFLSDATGLIVVKDPGFNANISVSTKKDCSVDEALDILKGAILLNGYTLVKTGNILKVIPLKYAKSSDINISKEEKIKNIKSNSDIITQITKLEYANVDDIVKMIRPLVSDFGDIIAYRKTNTLLLTDTSANIKRLLEIIKELDVDLKEEYKIEIFTLKNSNPKDMASLLENLGAKNIYDTLMLKYNKDLADLSWQIKGKIKAVPDVRTNTVIVASMETNFRAISEIISSLDKSMPQVLIQAVIIEVTLDEENPTGFKGIKELSLFENNELPGGGFSWLSYSGTHNIKEYSGFIKALMEKENVEVLSTPVILTSDSKEASISVGEEIPFVASKNKKLDCTYEYRDVGVKLAMIPHINKDNNIFLELHQEVKKRTGEILFDAPVIQTRKADTSVLVSNGQTVVIGGLLSESFKARTEYKKQKNKLIKTELVIFITPRIIINGKDILAESKDGDITNLTEKDEDTLESIMNQGFMEVKDDKKIEKIEKIETIKAELDSSSKLRKSFNKRKLRKIAAEEPAAVAEEPAVAAEEPAVAAEEIVEPSASIKSVDALYRRGVDFYNQGKYKGAIREFAPIMSIDPKYKDIDRYMYLAQNKYEEELNKQMKMRVSEEEKKERIFKEMTTVEMPMDMKSQEFMQKESFDKYYEKDTMFAKEKESPLIDKLIGKIIEISKTHDFVVIDKGSFSKVMPDMIFRVFRDNELVGKLKITEVDEHVSAGAIISKKKPDWKFQSGDIVVLAE